MTDVLDTALDALARVPSRLRWDDVTSRRPTAPTPVAPPSRRPTRALVAAAVVVLLVGVAAVVLTNGDDDRDEVHTEPGRSTSTPSTTTSTSPTTTAPAPDDQAARARSAVTAVTDDAYLVWGGQDAVSGVDRVDGFAVDLQTRSVTEIPPAPITPANAGDGVWTGSELVVWSGETQGEAAAWDPVDRAWRMVATPPGEIWALPSAEVWAGDRIVAVGPVGSSSYDPDEDAWTEIPTLPGLDVAGPAVEMVWTGEEVVAWVIKGFGGPSSAEDGGVLADAGWSWAPGDDAWTPLPDLPSGSRISYGSMVWTGSQVLVWGTATGSDGSVVGLGAVWEPDDRTWRPMAPSPQGRGDGFEATQGSEALAADPISGRVLVRPLDLSGAIEERETYLYDPGTDTWADVSQLLDGTAPPVTFDDGLTFHDGLVLRPDPTSPVLGPI